MIPETYRKEKKLQQSFQTLINHTSGAVLFLAGFYLVGPVAHELGHLVVLQAEDCIYTSYYGFNVFSGLRGSFEPGCSLNTLKQYLFYLSGFGLTLITGTVSLSVGSKVENRNWIMLGLGCLTSIAASITLEGDLHSVPGFEGSVLMLSGTILILAASASVFGVEKLIRKEETELR
ncbi:MAG: hypothetical protein J07AB43_13150 [Candidatus Nanosalina sp. J07AB43]|jgi:hypothetical protein|nr:MAG: hypothetical protein J07AB43_13150 [Candidatus Nanosalina sp. J07AB43]